MLLCVCRFLLPVNEERASDEIGSYSLVATTTL